MDSMMGSACEDVAKKLALLYKPGYISKTCPGDQSSNLLGLQVGKKAKQFKEYQELITNATQLTKWK